MTGWRLSLVVLAACLFACDSCGCGERRGGAPSKPSAQAGASGSGWQGGAGGGDPNRARRNALTPMPDTEERRDLEDAAKKIDVTADLGTPVSEATLAKALPDEIEDYEASTPASLGRIPAEHGSATVASRRYAQGKAVMNVKITDTADAPVLRAELVPQLTTIGNAPTGEQRGVLEDEIAGISAHHKAVNASRAMALIGGRFLVEVLVDNTIAPDDAWTAITELETRPLLKAANQSR